MVFYSCSGRKQAATMVKEWRSFIEISMSESDTCLAYKSQGPQKKILYFNSYIF
jgi:hypothetical protein